MSRKKKQLLENDLIESLLSDEEDSEISTVEESFSSEKTAEESSLFDGQSENVQSQAGFSGQQNQADQQSPSYDEDLTIAPVNSDSDYSEHLLSKTPEHSSDESDKTIVVADENGGGALAPYVNASSGDDDKTAHISSEDATYASQNYSSAELNSSAESTHFLSREPTQKFTPTGLSNPEKNSEEVRFGRVASDKVMHSGGSSGLSAIEMNLTQAESLRVAQERILSLESEIERIRQENEQLIAAGETIRRKSDDLKTRVEKAETNLREERIIFKEEKKIYKDNLDDKERENVRLRERLEELEFRLESDLKKIRVRERELENRLELMKMEEAALLRNKDEIILDLKRKIDQLNAELENYRGRSLELHKHMESDQERLRRTVRALRLALTMLEDGESTVVPLKKAE